MIDRQVEISTVSKKLERNPAVVLLGPRQVGKTTLAKLVIATQPRARYFDLESYNTVRVIEQDPESFLLSFLNDLIILDEVQELPNLFAIIRSVIDRDRHNGKFLLLGSADPKLISGISESLAGRASYYTLAPFRLSEIGHQHFIHHWFRGGFPNAYLARDDETYAEWMEDYVRAYSERDINLIFQINANPTLVKRLWRMLAALNGSLLNAAKIARSLGVSATTVNNYIDMLEAGFLLFKLQPWYANIGKRLVKSPKVYVADTGLLHSLLNIKDYESLLIHPNVGQSWEAYVIHQIRLELKDQYEYFFYRTHTGSEIDLLLIEGNTPIAAIEIKSSNNPTISKGFYTAIKDLKTKHNYVITKSESYVSIKGIQIMSVMDFLNQLHVLKA